MDDAPSQVNEDNEMIPDQDEAFSSLFGEVTPPLLLKESAGLESCCIFRIPHNFGRDNNTAYIPKIVSIGPYHHSADKEHEHLKMIQEHKKRYLKFFVSEISKKGVTLRHLFEVVSRMDEEIRNSYSENLDLNQEELTKVMLLDGCFILMLFLVVSQKIECPTANDPIFKLRWILPTLRSDFLLLENQVPLSLLNKILETSMLASSTTTSLNEMAFNFFKYSLKKPEASCWEKHKNLQAEHLLDLIRKTLIPTLSTPTTQRQCCIDISNCPWETSMAKTLQNTCLTKICRSKESTGAQTSPPPNPFLRLIISAKKLRLRGIKFKRRKNVDTPLDISFKNGLLEMPLLVFDDLMCSVLTNCVAFEQFNMKCSNDITSYVVLMSCLINTAEDATFLVEKEIIENYLGTGEQVSLFFKNIGKDISFSMRKSYLSKVFEQVNEYTSQGYHVQWAGFKYTHFNTPWTFLSSSAALLLLLLTICQAFFAAYAYLFPLKEN